MDQRKAKGRKIACSGRITRNKSGAWLVPSGTRSGKKYQVKIKSREKRCTCPDFISSGRPCKHIYAVTIYRSEYPKSNLIDAPNPPRAPKEKKTYPQKNWSGYHASQVNEKDDFLNLLSAAVDAVCPDDDAAYGGKGRPPASLRDMAYLIIYKVYEGFSTRRFMSDARAIHRSGYISEVPHFNTIMNKMRDSKMTPILMELITTTSLPLKGLEDVFAIDSSGFASAMYDRWEELKPSGDTEKEKKTTRERRKKTRRKKGDVSNMEAPTTDETALGEERAWTKVHLMCGVNTHIVTSVVIKDKHAPDSPQFESLFKMTAQNFNIREVCADKAYGAVDSYQLVAEHGVTPYIPFKSNQTGDGTGRSGNNALGRKLWRKMYHLFHMHSGEFEAHYHQRSNVETVFSMTKRKFNPALTGKTETAMVNEAICKLICHNIGCLIEAIYTLGYKLDEFLPQKPPVVPLSQHGKKYTPIFYGGGAYATSHV